MQFFTLGGSKIEVFETHFFYTMIRYVKHVLGRICMFFTLFRYWAHGWGGGGGQTGMVHNLLMQFCTPDNSKIEVFETHFFDIVIS